MTILTPDNANPQNLKFVPYLISDTNLNVSKITFIDEQTNTSEDAILGALSTESFYKTIEVTINLVNGRFYMAVFFDGTTEIFRDKVFVTDQPIQTFSVNQGVYEYAPSTPNEYIIYEQ